MNLQELMAYALYKDEIKDEISKEEFEKLEESVGIDHIKLHKGNVIIEKEYYLEMNMLKARLMDSYLNLMREYFDMENKYMRLKYGLPITKDLVYYEPNGIKHKVIAVRTKEKGKPNDTLGIFLEDDLDNEIEIYEKYFVQMQKPHFLEDKCKEEEEN